VLNRENTNDSNLPLVNKGSYILYPCRRHTALIFQFKCHCDELGILTDRKPQPIRPPRQNGPTAKYLAPPTIGPFFDIQLASVFSILITSLRYICEIRGFHGSDYEEERESDRGGREGRSGR
jgi:hypothetical protein